MLRGFEDIIGGNGGNYYKDDWEISLRISSWWDIYLYIGRKFVNVWIDVLLVINFWIDFLVIFVMIVFIIFCDIFRFFWYRRL